MYLIKEQTLCQTKYKFHNEDFNGFKILEVSMVSGFNIDPGHIFSCHSLISDLMWKYSGEN